MTRPHLLIAIEGRVLRFSTEDLLSGREIAALRSVLRFRSPALSLSVEGRPEAGASDPDAAKRAGPSPEERSAGDDPTVGRAEAGAPVGERGGRRPTSYLAVAHLL